MDFKGEKVIHRQFGIGEVVGKDEKTITVRFEQGDKQFLYPAAFDGFLTFTDAAQKAAVEAELSEIQADAAAKQSHLEDEESRRKATEQLAALKKNRTAAAKKAAVRKRKDPK
jgi:DNA-binding transcriptional regulator GbsR (MarR family)